MTYFQKDYVSVKVNAEDMTYTLRFYNEEVTRSYRSMLVSEGVTYLQDMEYEDMELALKTNRIVLLNEGKAIPFSDLFLLEEEKEDMVW